MPRVDGTCMNFLPLHPFHNIFSPIFLMQYIFVVIAHRPPPPPPKKKWYFVVDMFAKNENGKDRCSLNRNLEGKKGTQFSISLGKKLLLIEKHKFGHTLTK